MTKCCDSCGQPLPDASGIMFGPFNNQITCEGQRIQLTHTEATVFRALLKTFGRSVQNTAIYNQLYGLRPECDRPESGKNICVAISDLRKKLDGMAFEVVNDWGYGYLLRRRAATEAEAASA